MKTIHRIKEYLEKKGISMNAFDATIGAANGYIGRTIKNNGSVGSDMLEKIFCAYPDLDINWLLTGDGFMLKTDNIPPATAEKIELNAVDPAKSPPQKGDFVTENVTPAVTPTPENSKKYADYTLHNQPQTPLFLGESGMQYNLGAPKVITVNERKEENIIYVPVKARAGYLAGYGDPEFIQTLPTLRLPGLTNGTYRMFEIDGPSMAPNVISGDRVIGQWVSSFSEIRDNRVYIMVCRDGVVFKRVLNRIDQRGKLVFKSDTVHHRKEYPSYDVAPEDVLEIWYGRMKLSADFAEPAEVFHRLNDLEAEMTDLRAESKEINHTLELILKQLPPAKP